MTAKFEVFEDKAGEWRWRLRAANGQTVAASEGYTGSASHARRGAIAMARNALEAVMLLIEPEETSDDETE